MIDWLKTLQAVQRHSTFAQAGARLGLTQAGVSMQIHKLEAALGYQLMDRSRRKAQINDAGLRVLAQAQRIDALLAQLMKGVSDEDLTGHLRFGSITSSLLFDVPQACQALRRSLPQVDLHITPGVSPELLTAVEDGRLDAAIIVQPAHTLADGLEWVPMRRERFVLIAPQRLKNKPIKQLLTDSDFIRYERLSHGGNLVDRYLKRLRLKVRDVVELDSIEAIAIMVSQGSGVAIVPDTPCIAQLKLPLAVLDLGEQALYRHIGLVSQSAGPRQHLVRLLARALGKASTVA
jgi:DNA-binding transcriptional LysR family regulator